MRRALIASGTALFCLLLYAGFLNHTEPTEAGIARNLLNGDVSLQSHAGWNLTPPWVLVAEIDTRPTRVCVTSSGRGFNCKLVQFQRQYFREFVATEGFRYYWWSNRISLNMGYHEEYRGMRDLLRGYGYSVKPYPFVRTLEEYQ
jgi:hypothetical protein